MPDAEPLHAAGAGSVPIDVAVAQLSLATVQAIACMPRATNNISDSRVFFTIALQWVLDQVPPRVPE